jgi:6-phosphogluconolactonase
MNASRHRFFFCCFLVLVNSIALLFMVGCGQLTMASSSAADNPPSSPSPSPTATPSPTPAVANPNHFTYVTLQAASSVAGMKIDSTGAVMPISGSPFAVPEGPSGIARTQQFLFVSSDGFNLPLTADKYLITTYKIDPDTGALTEVARHQSLIPASLSVDPEQHFLYAKMRDGIAVFSISASGELNEIPGSPFSSSAGLEAVSGQIVLHPGGHFLYSLGLPSGHDPTVGMIVGTVDPITGAAAQGRFIAEIPSAITVTPDGGFLLATTSTPSIPNAICSYVIDPVNGYPGNSFSSLVPQATSCTSTGLDPMSVAVTPSGSFAVTANFLSDSLSVFAISSGVLTEVSGSPYPAGNGPFWITISGDGQFVFAFCQHSQDVTVYRLDATGVLTPVAGSPFKLGGVPFLGIS